MAKPDPRLLRAATAQSVVTFGLTLAHSLQARGPGRTALLAALGVGLPTLAELGAIRGAKVLRHHTRPQVAGVPLFVALSWYNAVYAVYAMLEKVVADARHGPDLRRGLPIATAAVATSLDLLTDPFGLDAGMWEWRDGGPYATEIEGPNGRNGVPVGNYLAWIALAAAVTALYRRYAGDEPLDRPDPWAAGSLEAGRTAALLIVPGYLGAALWALRERRPRYLAYSALFPLAAALALRGGRRR